MSNSSFRSRPVEHVADPEQALDEFARVLGGEGMLIVSTPNPREYLDENPFHLCELTPEEFLGALAERFAEVRPLYQQNFLTSAVLDADRFAHDDPEECVDLETRKVVAIEPGRELYTLALCGPTWLPPLDANLAVLSGVYEAHELARLLREATRDAEHWHGEIEKALHIQREWQARATEAERIQRDWEARATTAERIQQDWEARAIEAETAEC